MPCQQLTPYETEEFDQSSLQKPSMRHFGASGNREIPTHFRLDRITGA